MRIHSGQAMFVHAASSALVLPLGHARAMGGGGGASRAHALLEFDAKRAQYSYAPDYDILKEAQASERGLAVGGRMAPGCGGGGTDIFAALSGANTHTSSVARSADASMDIPRTSAPEPQPSPPPPVAPHSYNEGSMLSAHSLSADASTHSHHQLNPSHSSHSQLNPSHPHAALSASADFRSASLPRRVPHASSHEVCKFSKVLYALT